MATLFETAMRGYQVADEMIKEAKGFAAAKEEYGEGRASAPGLFSALQEQDLAANRDRRADNQDRRADNQDRRAETNQSMAVDNHEYNTRTREDDRNMEGLLNLVQGLRQARDDGQDLGEAFDGLADKLPTLGVDQADIPAMREELLANPDILDTYYASLVTPAQQAADAKTKKAAGGGDGTGATQGKIDVSRTINKMRGYYARLDELGGIRNTDKGMLDNLGRAASASGVGRAIGGTFGTEEQSMRETILGMRPSLINAMKSAEELGAKMFDSNRDMELWLATVTDPTQDLQTVTRLLDEFEAKYGMAQAGAGDRVVPINPKNTVDSENYQRRNGSDIDKITSGFKDPETGAIFQGGNPGDPANWRMP